MEILDLKSKLTEILKNALEELNGTSEQKKKSSELGDRVKVMHFKE